jgi:hypothetical protein
MHLERIVRGLVCGLTVIAAFWPGLGAAQAPDAGGVTYDFAAFTERLFPIPKTGAPGDLVDAEPFFDDPWGAGRKAWGKYIVLPAGTGRKFRYAFRYRMRHSKGNRGYAFVFYYNRDPQTGAFTIRKDVKGNNGSYHMWRLQDVWPEWSRFSREFQAPDGPDAVKIVIRIDGAGDLEFRDPSFMPVEAEAKFPIRAAFFPQSRLDGVYQVSEGQCGVMRLDFASTGAGKIPPEDCEFLLELPDCVRLLGTSLSDPGSRSTESLSDGRSRVRMRPRRGAFGPQHFHPTLLVGAVGSAGTAGVGTLEVFRDGRAVSERERIRFEIVPSVRAAQVPKRYMNGIFFYQRAAVFGDRRADGAFAGLMGDAGVRWVICNEKTDEQLRLWRAAGIRKITPQVVVDNGYHLGSGAGRPAEDSFVRAPSVAGFEKWNGYIDRSTCPLAVIEERDYFLKTTVPAITEALKGCDGLWANWEPFMYKGKGCCCGKCEKAFVEWRQAHPDGSRADFRSVLHGKLVRVIDKYVRQATGGAESVGFLPGISWREVASSWREKNPSPESKAIDYAADLGWIEPWGPYYYWDTAVPYLYEKRGPLVHFIAAKDIREQVDIDCPLPRRPKLMSFPNSVQAGSWISQPEWIGMAMDSFFFNRWEACCLYFFPEGYDARYWRTFAASTTRAAKYEDFVLDGERCDGRTKLMPIREYARPSTYVTAFIPRHRDVPLLQRASYRLGEEFAVAVFNFWEKGDAYFRLAVSDLADGKYRVFDENGVQYRPDAGRVFWTAAELAQGVFLRVKAARTCVFEIRPAAKASGPCSRVVTTAELAADCRAALPELADAAAKDAAGEAANKGEWVDAKGER